MGKKKPTKWRILLNFAVYVVADIYFYGEQLCFSNNMYEVFQK